MAVFGGVVVYVYGVFGSMKYSGRMNKRSVCIGLGGGC